MIWKGETREQYIARAQKDGIRIFAWWPTQMDDGRWVWLEHYWEYFQRPNGGIGWWSRAITREDFEDSAPKTTPPPRARSCVGK